MSTWIRSKLSFANTVSLLALFVALGGTGYAAITLPKNSVGPAQIKKNAVRASEIKKNAVRAGEIRKNAVRQSEIKTGGVGADEIQDGSLTAVEFAPGRVANLNADLLDGKNAADFLLKGDKAADSELLDGLDAGSLIRSAFAQADNDALTGAPGNVLTTNIEVPTNGFLFINAGSDVFNVINDDLPSCILQLNETNLPESSRQMRTDADANVNEEENCSTQATEQVTPGAYKVDLEGNFADPNTHFDEATLQVLFIPFGADGTQP